MKSREYGTWPPRNGLNAERQKLYDPYNRAMKGEAYLHVDEYASMDVEEYYRVPAQKDVTGDPGKQDPGSASSRNKRDNNSALRRQTLIRQVAGMVAGSVIITTSYTAAIQRQQEQKPDEPPASVEPAEPGQNDPAVVPPTTESEEPSEEISEEISEESASESITFVLTWKWSDDHRSATLELADEQGTLIKEIPAFVSVAQLPPTCNTEGTVTYTATADKDGEPWSDTYVETVAPLGHDFDEGEEIVLEDGRTVWHTECTRCGEEFTIENHVTEND